MTQDEFNAKANKVFTVATIAVWVLAAKMMIEQILRYGA